MKSYWFKRFLREVKKIDSQIRVIRLKMGFWRIYWKDHYVGEAFEEMSPVGYDIEKYDPRLESRQYYEEYEDHVEMVRTIKNFVEGYYDSIQRIKIKIWNLKHQKEFSDRSKNAYKSMVIK